MSDPAQPDRSPKQVRQEATASDHATINQAGRDLHIHHGGGVRRTRPGLDRPETVCPYPGLAAFTDEQAEWFFGRDQLSSELISRLDDHLTRGGPVIVVAASGAGKSSLLHAGLMHQVAGGSLSAKGSRQWPRIVFTPGAHPLREAAIALKTALHGESGESGESGEHDPTPDDLDDLLRRLLDASTGQHADRAVIVLDQFEELFTLCDSDDERKTFITWLWRASGTDNTRKALALVVCVLRADFYAQCVSGYPELRRSLQADQVVIGPMSSEELQQAIRFPAEAVGLDIEPGLIDLLLADLRAGRDQRDARDPAADYDAGRLPLLAHALRATWQQRHGAILTVDGYRATGGIEHAITATAERVYASLDKAGQREARVIFLRLVKIGTSSSEDARRLVTRTDLTSGSTAAATALDAYIDSRLVTASRNAVQITHEALLTAWPRLKDWLQDDRAADRQDIEDTAADWERSSGDPSLLYRGGRLETALKWAGDHSQELTGTAQDFLAASQRYARRASRLRRQAMVLFAALALIATAFAIVAFQQRTTANQQRDQAIQNQVLSEASQLSTTNPSLAAQLLLTTYRMRPSEDLASRLIDTAGQPLATTVTSSNSRTSPSVVYSPERDLLADGSGGAVTLWDVANPELPRQLSRTPAANRGDIVSSLAFIRNGEALAVGDTSGQVTLLNVTNPAHPRQLGPDFTAYFAFGELDSISSMAFSPNGMTLAIGDLTGEVTLWDVAHPARPRKFGPSMDISSGSANSLAFNPNGKTLAIGEAGYIALWDVFNPAQPRQLGQAVTANAGNTVYSVAFSPDGSTLASGDDLGLVTLWDVTNPAQPSQVGQALTTNSGNAAWSLAFSQDGRTLAVGYDNGTLTAWDVTNPVQPRQLGPALTTNSGNVVWSLAFSQDGKTLVDGDSNGEIYLWHLPPATLAGDSNMSPLGHLAFGPDGEIETASNDSGSVTLDAAANRPQLHHQVTIQNTVPGTSDPNATAFSPDGRFLATTTLDSPQLTLWSTGGEAQPRKLSLVSDTDGGWPSSIAFSPDAKILAIGDIYGEITLWDIANPLHPRPTSRPFYADSVNVSLGEVGKKVTSLAFSRDSGTLAAGDDTGRISLWDVKDPAWPRNLGRSRQPASIFQGDGSPVFSMAFSPDKNLLITGEGDSVITLWNVSSPKNPRPFESPITSLYGRLTESAAISPDGRTLASANGDSTITLWDITAPARPHQLESLHTSSGAETVTFSPDSKSLVAGEVNGSFQTWGLNINSVVGTICAATRGNLTRQQWQQYIPGLQYNPPCPAQKG